MSNRELQQQIRSLKPGTTAAQRIILALATGDLSTPAPTADDAGYNTDNEGILHLEVRDDNPAGPNPWTGGTFRLHFLDDELSGAWKAGASFTWTVATDGWTITVNLQGKKYVFLEVVSKTDAASEASFWGGVNTVEGA